MAIASLEVSNSHLYVLAKRCSCLHLQSCRLRLPGEKAIMLTL